MYPTRRQFLGSAALAALAPSFSLRASVPPPATFQAAVSTFSERLGESKPERIRLMAPQGSVPNLQPIIERFRDWCGIEVDLVLAPVDDINTRLMLETFGGGSASDAAVVATFGIPDLANAGALRPIDDFDERLAGARSLRDSSLYTLGDRFLGESYGPQVDGDVYLMFYNRALLEDPVLQERHQARFERPARPARTWRELDELLQCAHDPDRGVNGGLLFRTPRYIVWEYWVRLHAAGVLPFDDEMAPRLTEPAAVAALEALLACNAFLHPDAARNSLTDNWAAFANGDTLCNIGWGGSQKYFRKHGASLPGGVAVAPLPGFEREGDAVTLPYFNWGWNIVVPHGAAHPGYGYVLGVIATLPEVSTASVQAIDGFFDPYQEAHYADPKITEVYGPEFLNVHRAGMRTALPDLYVRGQGQYLESLSANLILANDGLVSPQEALAATSDRWERITDALGRDSQTRQWRELVDRYPEALREFR